MSTIFSGQIYTTFGQLYLASADWVGEQYGVEAFNGQINGLCGGAVPGGLVLFEGIHTGDVPITIEMCDTAPPVDLGWEDIVEASCVITETPATLQGCGYSAEELPQLVAGTYRARFCATAFGQTDAKGKHANSGERYALFLWPDTVRPDEIVKQSSAGAINWHETVAKRRNA